MRKTRLFAAPSRLLLLLGFLAAVSPLFHGRTSAGEVATDLGIWVAVFYLICHSRIWSAIRFSEDYFDYWDLLGVRHRIWYRDVCALEWAYVRWSRTKWNIRLHMDPRRTFVLRSAAGWRIETAQWVRDELIRRGGLERAELVGVNRFWRKAAAEPGRLRATGGQQPHFLVGGPPPNY